MLKKISPKGWLILGFALFVVGYGYFRVVNLIRGPELNIESPADGTHFTEPFIEIKGKAARVDKLKLNGSPIFIDEQGRFQESLLLGRGYNILVVEAEDRFSRHTSTTVRLVYEGPEDEPALPTPATSTIATSSNNI